VEGLATGHLCQPVLASGLQVRIFRCDQLRLGHDGRHAHEGTLPKNAKEALVQGDNVQIVVKVAADTLEKSEKVFSQTDDDQIVPVPAAPVEKPKGALVHRLLQWYDHMLRTRPLLTNAGNSFILSFLSNLSSQRLSGVPINFREAFMNGVRECPPYSAKWFDILEKKVGSDRAVLKVVLDQGLFRPAMMLYSFVLAGVLNGAPWAQTKAVIRKNLVRTILDMWKVWPLVTYASQYLPLAYRCGFFDVISFVWDMMVAMRMRVRS
jgi:hypothetical protein